MQKAIRCFVAFLVAALLLVVALRLTLSADERAENLCEEYTLLAGAFAQDLRHGLLDPERFERDADDIVGLATEISTVEKRCRPTWRI